jgi:hypothetical protein
MSPTIRKKKIEKLAADSKVIPVFSFCQAEIYLISFFFFLVCHLPTKKFQTPKYDQPLSEIITCGQHGFFFFSFANANGDGGNDDASEADISFIYLFFFFEKNRV